MVEKVLEGKSLGEQAALCERGSVVLPTHAMISADGRHKSPGKYPHNGTTVEIQALSEPIQHLSFKTG